MINIDRFLERVIRPTLQHVERASRKLFRSTNSARFLKLRDSWKKIHSTKIQLEWAVRLAAVLIGVIFLALLADGAKVTLLSARIVESRPLFVLELLGTWLYVAVFIFAFLRAISIVTSFPHIGWRRVLVVLGGFGALIGVVINLPESGYVTPALVSGFVVGFSVAPILLADGFRLWIWIQEGFVNPGGEP